MKLIKKGFNYSQDGPGNRLVFHMQGCNMRCPWCANPEGISVAGTMITEPGKLLDSVCPFGAIQNAMLDRKKCSQCTPKICLTERKNEGVRLSYFEQSVSQLLEDALESRPIFFDGGGVTFSGGEPTLQFNELKEALKAIKNAGIHTAIESNGTHEKLEELFPYIDFLIIDFKQADDNVHKKITKISNRQIKINVEKALKYHPNVLLRTPLIHGFNDRKTDMENFLEFYGRYNCSSAQFEFLKYHELGKEKWEKCGMQYMVKNGDVPENVREQFETEFRKNGYRVVRT